MPDIVKSMKLRCKDKSQRGDQFMAASLAFMAGLTGLEPATSGVTGRRCNRLYYSPESGLEIKRWWAKQGSNL